MAKAKPGFQLNQDFALGYRNREDVTVLKPGILVTGSKNVLTNTFSRIGARKGYTLDGQRTVAKVSATGHFQVTDYTKITTVDAGKTLTIGGVSLTFGTDIPTGGLVSNADLASRIVTAINASVINTPDSPIGVHAEIGTPPDHTTSQAVLIANVQGESGNLIDTSTTATATMFSLGPFLGGGLNQASKDPILSAYDWMRHVGDERHLRSYEDGRDTAGAAARMQYRYVASEGDRYKDQTFTEGQVYWIDLLTGQPSARFNYAEYWRAVSSQGLLLMVNGSNQMYIWGGGVGTLESVDNASGHIKTVSMPPAQADGGSGYGSGDVLTISGGTGGEVTVTSVGLQTGIIFVLDPNPNAFGSGYAIGNTFTINTGDGNAVGQVTAVSGTQATQVSLVSGGSGYSTGPNKPTTAITGTGSGLQVNIVQITQLANSVKTVALKTPGSGYSVGTFSTTGGQGTGAKVTIDAISTGSVTLAGSKTLGEMGFLFDGTLSQQVRINGNLYTYDSIFNRTFFGISADATGEAVGSVVHQEPNVQTNDTMPGLPLTFGQTYIAVLYNQIYFGNDKRQDIYISKQNLFNFTVDPAHPPGGAFTLTLDAPPRGFIVQNNAVFISSGRDYWHKITFTLSGDLLSETITPTRIKTTYGQGAQSQSLMTKIKNAIAYVSFEPIVNVFGTAQNYLDDPQTQDISYPIVEDMNSYDFTDGWIKYFRKQIYLTIPRAGVIRIYNMTNDFSDQADISPSQNHYWEAPLTIPMGPLSFVDGKIIGHSSQDSNSYVLFDGGSDDGRPIEAKAVFSYENAGARDLLKKDDATYVEAYMTKNTKITLGIQKGVGQSPYEYVIDGADTQIVPPLADDSSLGKNPLGKVPLGSSLAPADQFIGTNTNLPKVRVVKTYPKTPWFERQVSFKSLGVDQVWELLAFGSDTQISSELATNIFE